MRPLAAHHPGVSPECIKLLAPRPAEFELGFLLTRIYLNSIYAKIPSAPRVTFSQPCEVAMTPSPTESCLGAFAAVAVSRPEH